MVASLLQTSGSTTNIVHNSASQAAVVHYTCKYITRYLIDTGLYAIILWFVDRVYPEIFLPFLCTAFSITSQITPASMEIAATRTGLSQPSTSGLTGSKGSTNVS